jgi:SecD/SecF fusion protein
VITYAGKSMGFCKLQKWDQQLLNIKTNAYWAVLGAMAIVFLYLMISFRKWQYSLGAIAAVAHDVIFV